jgi:peptidase E
MTARPPRIVAMGGGGFSMEPENPALDRHVLALTGVPRPKVAFVPTASGDADGYVTRFYDAFKPLDCEPSHLGLFRRTIGDLREFVLAQDVVYVGGGNTLNMLSLWRLHGLDAVFREAWERGVVLAGLSAGALCWFEEGVTDSLGPLAPIPALGLLPGSLCVHYDGEADRRPTFHALLAEGKLGAGYAADDGAALCFEGTALREVVTSRPAARAYRVELGPEGVVERALPVRFLG